MGSGIKRQPPFPSLVYPTAQAIGIYIGAQRPFPIDFYPSGQTTGGNSHTPFEFLKYPFAHANTAVSNTQIPFPSGVYPLEQISLVGGVFGSIGTQFPSPSDSSSLAQ